MNSKLTIEEVENGYILTDEYDGEKRQIVIGADFDKENFKRFKTMDEEKVLFGLLLEEVANHFLYEVYDKWGRENLEITFNKKGYKVD